jgi:hypothetical protein
MSFFNKNNFVVFGGMLKNLFEHQQVNPARGK